MSFKQRLVELIKNNNRRATQHDIETITNKIIKYDKDINEVLTNFNLQELKSAKNKHVFPIILRTGGIGDLIALSSIAYHIPLLLKSATTNIKFVSQEKYRAVFDWYARPVSFISYFSPVAKYESNTSIGKSSINKRYKPIYFEGVIENSKENWFVLQYKTIGANEFDFNYGRPVLKTNRITTKPSNIDLSKKSILINCRSTAIIRSMRFQDIYESLIECIGDMDVNIYTHDKNLRDYDLEFIKNINDNRIKIISAKSLADFFLDVYDVTLSISVDTAQFHFREGVEKAAIGLYGPFPYECRTQYYKYTKSLNIKSTCPNMPCYIHVKRPDAFCEFEQNLIDSNTYDSKWKEVAPCCCGEWNTSVKTQIVNEFKSYIVDTLNSL